MKSPLQETLEGVAPRKRRHALRYVLVGGILAALVSASLAASITVNSGNAIEFGQGTVPATGCTASATVSLGTAVDASGNVETSTISITGVSTSCFGKYLRATLTGGSPSAVRDQVVWQLVNVGGSDTAMTVTASVGGSTSASNSSSGGTSTIYPLTGVTLGGMLADLAATNVSSVQLETSDSVFAASA